MDGKGAANRKLHFTCEFNKKSIREFVKSKLRNENRKLRSISDKKFIMISPRRFAIIVDRYFRRSVIYSALSASSTKVRGTHSS